MKHAYLILAHDDFDLLNILLKQLDSENTDIYIHIDKSCKYNANNILIEDIKYSKVYFVEREESLWGSIGIVYATLNLLKKALYKNNYDYYHLLSGHDLLIKNKKSIDKFFEDNLYNNKSKKRKTNYIDFYNINNNYKKRYIHYNLFINEWRSKNIIIKAIVKIINIIGETIQNVLRINRFKDEIDFLRVGSEWWSISNELCSKIIENEKWIYKMYDRYSFAADESFMQTFVTKFEFQDTLYSPKKDENSNLREIIFNEENIASPYVFKESDIDSLKNSKNLIARKFSTNIDKKIIERITK